jgi:pimeloyl-ACP methyl ester carboxylesterase
MSRVRSCDGTPIAYRSAGAGPPVVLAGYPERTAAVLARWFTVYVYDRRGTGASGNTAPYAVAREVEDLMAVMAATGGTPGLAGWGTGAVLALEAARRRPDVAWLAVAGLGPLVDQPCRDGTLHRLVREEGAPIPADLAARRWSWLGLDLRSTRPPCRRA